MARVMVIWLTVMGFCAIVALDPYEFWIDAEPNIFLGVSAILLFCAGVAFWVYCVGSSMGDEEAVALTSYINNCLTESERLELAEPDLSRGLNSGYMRWKKDAKSHPLAHLIPASPPRYAHL